MVFSHLKPLSYSLTRPVTGSFQRLQSKPSDGLKLQGGFGSYLLGLNKKTYEQAGVDTEGNTPGSYKELKLGWMTGFLFVTSFVGLWALVPLRKIMIIDYKLTNPSETATAILINGFHTRRGDDMAKKQVRGFLKFFSISFLLGFFQWFYSGGAQCRFSNFPTFGLKAWKQSLYSASFLSIISALHEIYHSIIVNKAVFNFADFTLTLA